MQHRIRVLGVPEKRLQNVFFMYLIVLDTSNFKNNFKVSRNVFSQFYMVLERFAMLFGIFKKKISHRYGIYDDNQEKDCDKTPVKLLIKH